MPYVDARTAFAPCGKIVTLDFDEIGAVGGANDTSNALYVVAGTAATVASVAARAGAPQVAAGAAVVGLVAFVAAAIID